MFFSSPSNWSVEDGKIQKPHGGFVCVEISWLALPEASVGEGSSKIVSSVIYLACWLTNVWPTTPAAWAFRVGTLGGNGTVYVWFFVFVPLCVVIRSFDVAVVLMRRVDVR